MPRRASMDAFSAAIGAAQIEGQCATATMILARYINQVPTVDQKIKSFYEDLNTLKTNYVNLEHGRSSPQMVAAARAADQYTENLWSQLATTLKDCENTLVAVNEILDRISAPPKLPRRILHVAEPPLKQIRESLWSGELGRHHERIRMFTTSLALPLQMITITLQLSQQDLSEDHLRRLDERLINMQQTIDALHVNIAELRAPHKIRILPNASSSTLVGERDVREREICENMENFASRAKYFLSNASTIAASTQSGGNVGAGLGLVTRNPSLAGIPLTLSERGDIQAWAPTLPQESLPSWNESEAAPPSLAELDVFSGDDEDFELVLVRTYIENGQADLEKVNGQADHDRAEYAKAEENFVEALNLLQLHDFGDRLALQAADVLLLLTRCHVEQEKYDEAIGLLLPLTEENAEVAAGPADGTPIVQKSRKRPDRARVLAAHHSLGNIFMRKQEYENAEKHALHAFKERRKMLGPDHEKTLESVQLVVDVYTAKGERAKARAHETFLHAGTRSSRRVSTDLPLRPLVNNSTTSGAPSTISRKAVPIERTQTASSLQTVPVHVMTTQSPPNVSTGRHPSVDLHRPESQQTNAQQPPASPGSVFDDTSTIYSTRQSNRANSGTPKQHLKPRFDSIKDVAVYSKKKACDAVQHLLRNYDPEPGTILIHRWDDIKKNIKHDGSKKGLAATGSGFAPIHFFCELKEEQITEVELLIDANVDLMAVRYRAGYGKQEPMTPLQLALERDHNTVARMMIDALQKSKVPMSQVMALKDRNELSPLLVACRKGQVDTVTKFLQYGAAVPLGFPAKWFGNSLLHDACSRCDLDMVYLLLSIQGSAAQRHDIGAVDQQDRFGQTPLMFAVMSKHISDLKKRDQKLRHRHQCVEILLHHARSDLPRVLGLQDSKGMDVLAHARAEADDRLIELIEQYAGTVTGTNAKSAAASTRMAVELFTESNEIA